MCGYLSQNKSAKTAASCYSKLVLVSKSLFCAKNIVVISVQSIATASVEKLTSVVIVFVNVVVPLSDLFNICRHHLHDS